MRSSFSHTFLVLQMLERGHSNPPSRQATGTMLPSDAFRTSPTVYSPMFLESMYPPPFPCMAETRPALTRFGMIASMYFKEMSCLSAISLRGT